VILQFLPSQLCIVIHLTFLTQTSAHLGLILITAYVQELDNGHDRTCLQFSRGNLVGRFGHMTPAQPLLDALVSAHDGMQDNVND